MTLRTVYCFRRIPQDWKATTIPGGNAQGISVNLSRLAQFSGNTIASHVYPFVTDTPQARSRKASNVGHMGRAPKRRPHQAAGRGTGGGQYSLLLA